MGIFDFISKDEKRNQKLKEAEAIIHFGIATEKISNIIYKECPVEHKSVIKFETAVFVLFNISSMFDISIYKYYENVSPMARDHIATIGGYKEEHIDKRVNYYHPSRFSDEDLYVKFSGLVHRALMEYGNDWKYDSDWHDFLEFNENNKNIKIYNIMFEQIKNKIERVINRTIKIIEDPYFEAEDYC
jgi:hypothetical protein